MARHSVGYLTELGQRAVRMVRKGVREGVSLPMGGDRRGGADAGTNPRNRSLQQPIPTNREGPILLNRWPVSAVRRPPLTGRLR